MARNDEVSFRSVSYEEWHQVTKEPMKTIRVINAAALAEPAVLWGVALYIGGAAKETFADFSLPFVPWIALAVGLGGLVAAWLISREMLRRNFERLVAGTWKLPETRRRKFENQFAAVVEKLGDPGRLYVIAVQASLVRIWILQGAATLVAVSYMLQPSRLTIATGLILFIALVREYPSWMGLSHWISESLHRLESERTLLQLRRS